MNIYESNVIKYQQQLDNIVSIFKLLNTVSYESITGWLSSETGLYAADCASAKQILNDRYFETYGKLMASYEGLFRNMAKRFKHMFTTQSRVYENIKSIREAIRSMDAESWRRFEQFEPGYKLVNASIYKKSVSEVDAVVSKLKDNSEFLDKAKKFFSGLSKEEKTSTTANLARYFKKLLKEREDLLDSIHYTFIFRKSTGSYIQHGFDGRSVKALFDLYIDKTLGSRKICAKMLDLMWKFLSKYEFGIMPGVEFTDQGVSPVITITIQKTILSAYQKTADLFYLLDEYFKDMDYMFYRISEDLKQFVNR